MTHVICAISFGAEDIISLFALPVHALRTCTCTCTLILLIRSDGKSYFVSGEDPRADTLSFDGDRGP